METVMIYSEYLWNRDIKFPLRINSYVISIEGIFMKPPLFFQIISDEIRNP